MRATALRLSLLGAVALVAAACGASGDEGTARRTTTVAGAADVRVRVASLACDGETTRVRQPRVAAQPDGIHLRIANTSGRALAWSAESERAGGTGAGAPPGRSEHVVDLPPGTLRVACVDPAGELDPGEVPRAALEVVDAEGVWMPAVVDADCSRFEIDATFASGAEGEDGSPVQVVRERLEPRGVLREGDRLLRAGYPETRGAARVVLSRDGRVVAAFALERAGGGWLLASTEACTGIGLDPG